MMTLKEIKTLLAEKKEEKSIIKQRDFEEFCKMMRGEEIITIEPLKDSE